MKKMIKVLVLFGILSVFFSCRNEEDNRPRIEKIEFETENKTFIEGDTVKITVTAQPIEAKKHDKIKYWTSDNSLIEILPESNNDYVVFRGLKQGQGIIKASVNGMDIFCDVTVISSNGTLIPYIVVSDYVIESETGKNHQIIASLIGGYPSDNSDFEWSYTGQNKNVINLVANNNVAVIDTFNVGDSVVTVSHKKALFEVSTLVFVREKGEIPVYISTGNNVISMRINEEMKEYSVNLFGKNIIGNDNNYHLFRHDIIDVDDEIVKESNVIGLQYRNNVGTIKPKSAGIAKIRVSHQDADYPVEIVVIVNEPIEIKYIDTEDTVIIMDEGEFRMVRVNVVGEVPDNYVEKFDYVNEDKNVIEVSHSQNIISIKALKKGKSIIKIKNEYVDFDKEILIIVNGIETLIDQEKYITTNQNVITTEVNGEATLKMTLVGGNSADANNFVWTVDDGSIIEVANQHGSVRYKNRSLADITEERFEATALIRAKKIGTTTITLENPKARNSFQVIVKVYKQNVLGVVPIIINGNGVYKIETGKILNVILSIATGLERNFTNARWESSDASVFTVESNTALTGVLKGRGYGIAILTVKGDNLKGEFSAVVIVGNNDYFDEKPYIYVNNPYMTLIKDRMISFRVNCVNVLDNDIKNLSVVNNSNDKLEVFSYRNNVTVRGLSFGEGEIIISGEGLNMLKVTVMVEDYALTPDVPYYLRPEKYIYGMVKGNSIEIQVDLVGGIAVNEKNIGWEINDENIAGIKGNGKKCIITGKNEGQTVLKASHYQAQNQDVEIVIYVVLSDAELKSKVVVHVPEQNILLRLGETRFISVITDAADGQNDFRWGNENANIIGLRVNGDKKSAFIDGVTLGNATVTVGYGNQSPFVIYVSVVSPSSELAYINTPSIVEMIAGQTITIKAVTNNVYNTYDINWASQDESIAKAYGNGDKCTVTAFKGGKTVIEVRYPGFVKDIVLRVYNNADEMANTYIFAGEQSRYVINKGDIVNIGLVFGIKGYSEHDLPNIRWTTNDGSKIELTGSGKTAGVKGLAAGFWKIKAADNYGNNIEIEIAVQEPGKAGKYSFSIDNNDRIKGMLAGNDAYIKVRVFNGANEVYNVSGIEYTVENSDIIRVEGNEGGVRVFAKPGKEGQSYISITHDLAEDGKILIYTSLTESGLANAFPIMVEKTNYMAAKGDAFNVKVQTVDDNSNKLANINYGLEKNNGVLSIQERNKKEIAVSAEKEGSEVILIYYNANVVQRVYVSVMGKGYGLNAGYMVTESIIGLVIGQIYETRIDIDTNWGIEWISANSDICEIIERPIEFEEGISIVELDGKKALLKANNAGETILTVKRGDIERYILVFVVNTQEDLKTYNAINIEQRKYKIPKGMDVTVNLHSYQGKVEGETIFEDYYRYSAPYGNVLAVNKTENGKISVKGINEGTAVIKITNSFYNSDMVVYVEVYPANEGITIINEQGHYITAEKTLYILSSEMREVYMQVSVLPQENFYGDSSWEWKGYDENIISVNAMGRSALVKGIKEGETKIKVQNQMCGNTLEITIIVGDRYVIDSGKIPYIYVAKDVFETVKGSGNLSIPYSIVNVDNIEMKNITFNVAGSGIRVTHDVDNGIFNIEAVNTGINRFEIKYNDLKKDVFVLVKENLNAGNIYFTTSENFVIASIGELRNISIDLIGYDEIDSGKIKWSLSSSSPHNIVQLAGNGLVGQVYGVAEGSVVINITHDRNDEYKAVYPLSINVKIVKDKSKENVVYLTTQRNVIETVEGASEEIIYIQKVGGDPKKSKIEWTVDNAGIVSLDHNGGYSARFTVHNEGSAKITATNQESSYPLNIVVVVRKSTGSNVYITTKSNLIWMSPGEENCLINVDLVNGESKDFNRITWNVYSQIPSETNVIAEEGNVINIVSSNEKCYINAVNVGVAYIRVECAGKVDLPLIITIYVSHIKEIRFGVQHKDIVMSEFEIVDLQLPTYERLKDKARVWAEDLRGGSTDVINVYYTNKVVMIQGIKTGNAVIKAEVEGKEGNAEMTVSVFESYSPNINRIVVGKNLYIMSDISGQHTLNADITGPGITDIDLDNIQWEITRNYEEDDVNNKKPFLSIYPENDSSSTLKSTGRKVQITPKNIGNAVIKVKHPKVTKDYWKDIYIIIGEIDERFTIVEKGPIQINKSHPMQTLSVNIIGGTNKNYEQVRWVAKMQQRWDGSLIEVVRIMGSGREVLLMPVNNGETEVYAFYNGIMKEVTVECVEDYYFNITNTNELMYPGEERDMYYEVYPESNNVTWLYNPADTGPVIVFNEIAGSAPGGAGNITRMLRVTALKEGNAQLIGMPFQGKPAVINITVLDDFEFRIDGNIVTNEVLACNYERPEPKYTINKRGRYESHDGKIRVSYTVYPGNAFVKLMTKDMPDGLSVEITTPRFTGYDSKRRAIYGGYIILTGLKEMNEVIKVELYRHNSNTLAEEPFSEVKGKVSKCDLRVLYYYKDENMELVPVFIRGVGYYSNLANSVDFEEAYNYSEDKFKEKIIKKQYLNNDRDIPNGETVNKSYSNRYMTLGDGEEHYIIFDKLYDSAVFNIKGIEANIRENTSHTNSNDLPSDGTIYEFNPFPNDPDYITSGKSTKFTVQLVDLSVDGVTYKALKLSGGKDYMYYNRVLLHNRLFISTQTKTSFTDNGSGGTEGVQLYKERYDNCSYSDNGHSYGPITIYRYNIIEGNLALTPNQIIDGYIFRNQYTVPGHNIDITRYVYSLYDVRKNTQPLSGGTDIYHHYNLMTNSYAYGNNRDPKTSTYSSNSVVYPKLKEVTPKEYEYNNDNLSISDGVVFAKYENVRTDLSASWFNYDYNNRRMLNYGDINNIGVNTNIPLTAPHDYTFFDGSIYDLNDGFTQGGRINTNYYNIPHRSAFISETYNNNTKNKYTEVGHRNSEKSLHIFPKNTDDSVKYGGIDIWSPKLYVGISRETPLGKGAYFTPVYVTHRAEWDVSYNNSNNIKYIVPAKFFNRFPYRFEGTLKDNDGNDKKEMKQLIYVNDGDNLFPNDDSKKAMPMPSINRKPIYDSMRFVRIKVNYSRYSAVEKKDKDKEIYIYVACVVRPSHMNCFITNSPNYSLKHDDDHVTTVTNNSLNVELKGNITTFSELNEDSDKWPILKYVKLPSLE